MITNTMTPAEVIKELKKIDSFILGRMIGLSIKNNKKLKNKFVQDGEVMSVSNYTIPETQDKVVVYSIKQVYTVKGKDYASLTVIYYVKTYYNTFITPSFDSESRELDCYVEFTHHAEDRMMLRMGKDFDTFFKEDFIGNWGAFHPVEYDHNGDVNECVAHVGDAFLILENEDIRYVVKTVLTEELLYAPQLQDKLDSKIGGESFWEEQMKLLSAEAENNLKLFKREGVLRAV